MHGDFWRILCWLRCTVADCMHSRLHVFIYTDKYDLSSRNIFFCDDLPHRF